MTAITAERRGPDRRRKRVFHLPERRSGFDRRALSGGFSGLYRRLLAWYRDQPRVIAAVLAAVVSLNLADLLLTLRALELGATEANPVMAALLAIDPTLAGWFKLLAGLGVVLVIWQMRSYRRILEVSLVALAGFSALLAYQLALVVGHA